MSRVGVITCLVFAGSMRGVDGYPTWQADFSPVTVAAENKTWMALKVRDVVGFVKQRQGRSGKVIGCSDIKSGVIEKRVVDPRDGHAINLYDLVSKKFKGSLLNLCK